MTTHCQLKNVIANFISFAYVTYSKSYNNEILKLYRTEILFNLQKKVKSNYHTFYRLLQKVGQLS